MSQFRALAQVSEAMRLAELGNYSEAEEAVNVAIEMAPDMCSAYQMRAQVRIRMGKHEEAIEDAETGLRLVPTLPEVYPGYRREVGAELVMIRGHARALSGMLERALADLDKAVELDGNLASAHEIRAAVLFNLDRYGEAADAFSTAVRGGSIEVALWGRASAKMADGDFPGAASDFRSFIEVTDNPLLRCAAERGLELCAEKNRATSNTDYDASLAVLLGPTCNHEGVCQLLASSYQGRLIPVELSTLIDAYLEDPGYETALALVGFAPEIKAIFAVCRISGGETQ